MARTDTRARIQDTAVALFMTRGVEKTSLREIAEQLDITKAALYYHFPSKDELVRSLLDPFLAGIESLLAGVESGGDVPVREFLEAWFDLFFAHRRILQLIIRDLSSFANLGLEDKLLGWQVRLRHLVVGPDAGVADQVRAVFALGGLQDVAALLDEIPIEQAREIAVEAALAALSSAPAVPADPDPSS